MVGYSRFPVSAIGLTLCCAGAAWSHETVQSAAPPDAIAQGQIVGQAALSYGYNDNLLFVADQPLFFPAGGDESASFVNLSVSAAYEWPSDRI